MAVSTPINTREGRPEINADLQDIAHRIHEEFDERLDPRLVDESLVTVAATFADASVRSFVPLLVRRYVSEDLQARLARG
jgi:RNase H-fold protein (predicted Holliday junction resolvase)